MDLELDFNETRVIGSLIEKEKTTPDQYPLSLNALTLACNQKSNREPVVQLTEAEVQDTLDSLRKKHLIQEASGSGSRVTKYRHRFCNTEFSKLQFTDQELAIICVLFLRGPQTPGELRSRTNRLCVFKDVQETESVLLSLSRHEQGPFVKKLPREMGKREARYAHLFSGEESGSHHVVEEVSGDIPSTVSPGGLAGALERIEGLENEVAQLRGELQALKDELGVS